MPNGNGLSIREREDRITRRANTDKIAKRQMKIGVVDVLGVGGGLAVGATLTRGMDLGPIPIKINTAAGLVGLYLLFTSKPNEKMWRKGIAAFALGMGAERVFDISEDRLGGLLEGWMNGDAE